MYGRWCLSLRLGRCKSLWAPSEASSQDANVLMSSFLEKMTDSMEILTAQLKPNEAAASGSKRGQGSKKVAD